VTILEFRTKDIIIDGWPVQNNDQGHYIRLLESEKIILSNMTLFTNSEFATILFVFSYLFVYSQEANHVLYVLSDKAHEW